jgi:hypothetical protein
MILISSPPQEHPADIFRSAIEIKTLYVANMSPGATGTDWESLKRNESLCNMARYAWSAHFKVRLRKALGPAA